MTTTPAQPVQGPYRVSALAGDACGYWVHAADGSVVGHVSNTARYIRLDNGEAWNKCVEPYSSYREWIKPELAHEAEIRKATARLLAASWEMREALRGDLETPDAIRPLSWLWSAIQALRDPEQFAADYMEDPSAIQEMISELEELHSKATAAIAKAETP